MTQIERLQAKLAALHDEVGPKAYISITVRADRLSGSLYTHGIAPSRDTPDAFDVWSDLRDPIAIVDDLHAKWLAERERRCGRTLERMALEIIRLTAEFGECTDAALRAEFDPKSIADLAGKAVERANEMASNGPFSIRTTALANAA